MNIKFQFNLQTQTLKLVGADCFLTLPQDHQFRKLGGIGFTLDYSKTPNRWIIFSVYKEKVRVVYKSPTKDNSIIYYQRELTRPNSGIIEVEFTKWDQVEKPTRSKTPTLLKKGRNKSE